MTGASVNFKAVKSAIHAVSHAARTAPPTYLLPPDKSYGTVVLLDDAGAVASTLEAKMALASGRAKVDKRYSPVWEGILNLRRPEPGEDGQKYKLECGSVVRNWCEKYEASTGHKVLRVDVHLDEGHMVDGEALLNAHAHVIADRTNDLGRVIKLSPKQLRELQTMTAEVTSLERGKSSFETGRKHISHHAYKHLAEQGRLETQQVAGELEKAKGQAEYYGKLIDAQNARAAQLKAQYDQDRAALKASGEATQKAYQALKKTHEAALAELKAQAMAVITPLREEVKTMKTQITQLEADNAKLAADKARFAEMANAYQAEKAKGTPAHLIQPTPEATKTAQEPSKAVKAPIPLPATAKELEATFKEFREGWAGFVKAQGFTLEDLNQVKGDYHGPILDQDDIFAVQKTGQHTCVIHQLSELDARPAEHDPKLRIQYKAGRGHVTGGRLENSNDLGL